MNRESMKEISSAATVEVTFVTYDIYKQEGGNLSSNSGELLDVQLLVFMTLHVLAKSDSKMMSAYDPALPAFISRSLLQFRSFAERSIKTKMIKKYIQNDFRHKRSVVLVLNSQKYNIERHQKWERYVWIK